MEDEALKNYSLDELLRDPQILEKLSPNINLIKSILSLKDSIWGEALETAKKIVAQVVEEIRKKLEKEIKAAFRGKKLNNVYNGQKSIRNLDIKKTLRANLKNYNKDMGHIVIERPYFNQRQKEYNKWSVVILVDESGSMLDSVIHSAIMAGIFADLKSLDTKLVIFDTEIVDLSSHIDDIVRTLMSVRLGGGTNITKEKNKLSLTSKTKHRNTEAKGYEEILELHAKDNWPAFLEELIKDRKKTDIIKISDFGQGTFDKVRQEKIVEVEDKDGRELSLYIPYSKENSHAINYFENIEKGQGQCSYIFAKFYIEKHKIYMLPISTFYRDKKVDLRGQS
jgi:hypothetical protein